MNGSETCLLRERERKFINAMQYNNRSHKSSLNLNYYSHTFESNSAKWSKKPVILFKQFQQRYTHIAFFKIFTSQRKRQKHTKVNAQDGQSQGQMNILTEMRT